MSVEINHLILDDLDLNDLPDAPYYKCGWTTAHHDDGLHSSILTRARIGPSCSKRTKLMHDHEAKTHAVVPHPTAAPCPDGTVPACGLYEGFAVVPCLCTMGTTAKQCTDARPRAELTIQRIESMAHVWLQRFGLRRVTDGIGMERYREAGLRTAGLSEVFVVPSDDTWEEVCQAAARHMSSPTAHRWIASDLSLNIDDICELPSETHIAVRIGRIASLLAWHGLSAPGDGDAPPDVFGPQHPKWHIQSSQ